MTGIPSNRFVIGDDTPTSSYDALSNERAKGLIPRNYDEFPQGCYAAAPAWDIDSIPLVPWDEIPDRIAHMTETKTRLLDLVEPLAPLDQNGQGYCTTEETEVLTERGWVQWPNYNGSDLVGTMNPFTGNLEFQRPIARQIFEYDGPIVGSTNRRIDFAVTPNHRMLVHKWDEQKRTLSNQLSFVKAKDIGWYAGLPHSTTGWVGTHVGRLEVPGDREYTGDDFVALLGLIVSDGYAGGTEKTKNWVSFASFRESDRAVIARLANRCGFHESPSRPGVWVRYDAGALAEWLRTHCYVGGELGALNKKVPQIIKELSMGQIGLFLKFFDDRNRNGTQFFTASKRLADDIQELFMKLSKRSHIGEREGRISKFDGNVTGQIVSKRAYVVTVGQTDRLCIDRKKHLETDHYKGNVYCVTVPNSTLVTRLNGSVLVSGNCWFYSGTAAVQCLRMRNNQANVRLSGHSGAWVIKNGRNQGGWGAQGLDFLRDSGVMPVSLWPEKSMDGRRYNTEANWKVAAEYRVTEGFVDLSVPQYDRELTVHQILTCYLNRIPVISDFNWWGHSVCGLWLYDAYPNRAKNDPKRYAAHEILNSWNQWGDNGRGILKDSKAFPDSASAPRATWGN